VFFRALFVENIAMGERRGGRGRVFILVCQLVAPRQE
jgi:hypothetical protein